MFYGDPALDDDLPLVNEAFWSSLIQHIQGDRPKAPRAILDIGCHTGGLLFELNRVFTPSTLMGIEPLADARLAAAKRLANVPATVTLSDVDGWDQVAARSIDLVTSHETLYLEPVLSDFMSHVHRVLSHDGAAYVVLGSHSENPLWQTWKKPIVEAGNTVYDHAPLDIMAAASSAGLLPSVQPLRRSGWVTYDPLRADFRYPDARTMFDHHYRHKLIFRFRIAHDQPTTS